MLSLAQGALASLGAKLAGSRRRRLLRGATAINLASLASLPSGHHHISSTHSDHALVRFDDTMQWNQIPRSSYCFTYDHQPSSQGPDG